MEQNNNYFTESFEAVVTDFDKVVDDLKVRDDDRNLIDFQDTNSVTDEENEEDLSAVRVLTGMFHKLTSKIELDEKSPPSKAVEDLVETNTGEENKLSLLKDVSKTWNFLNKLNEDIKEDFQISTSQFLNQLAAVETYSVELVTDARTDIDLVTDVGTEIEPRNSAPTEMESLQNTRTDTKPLQESLLIRPEMNSEKVPRIKFETESICRTISNGSKAILDEAPKFELEGVEFLTKFDTADASENFNTSEVIFRTRNPIHVINFEWSLENFPDYLDTVYSAEFSGQDCEQLWRFHITFKPIPNSSQDMLEVFIKKVGGNSTVRGEFDLRFLNSSGDMLGGWESKALFTDSNKCHSCIQTMLSKEEFKNFSKSEISNSPAGELIIKGRVRFQGCCVITKKLEKPILKK